MLLGGKNKFPCTVIASTVGHNVPAVHIKQGVAVYFRPVVTEENALLECSLNSSVLSSCSPKVTYPSPSLKRIFIEERSGGTTHLRTFFYLLPFSLFYADRNLKTAFELHNSSCLILNQDRLTKPVPEVIGKLLKRFIP